MPTATNRGDTPDKSEMKACDTQAPLSKDDPRIIAWNAYKATGDYKNTRNWALHDAHVDGSLWAAFIAGWSASSRPPADQVPDMVLREAAKTLLDKIDADSAVRWKFFNELAALRSAIAALQAVPAASEVGENAVRDPWNPDPDDPFWMLEVRQGYGQAGSWLKNEKTYLTTRDAIMAIRFPSRFAAECTRRSLPLEHSGRFEPTEHLWINHAPEPPALKASGEE